MQENVVKIHRVSMRILEKTGMKFHHPDAIDILKKNGIRVEGNIAYFTEKQIMYWVKKAPASANVYAGDSQYDVEIGGNNVYNAPAAGPTFIMDKDGNRRNAKFDDFIKMIKLYEVNPSYKINGGVPCQPEEIPSEFATLLLHYSNLLHSNKSIWTGTGNYKQMEAVIKLTCTKYGITAEELMETPRLLAIVNTNTPLQFDINMTETMLTFLKYRQPLCVTAASMGGTTAPITMAGILALVNAEVISTIALTQMYAPGAPVIYGSQATNADLQTCSIAIGSPEGALSYKYCAEMAKFYGIPSRAGGALCDAKSLNAQAGYESMLTYYACIDSGVNAIFQSAGILDSYLAASFEKMVVDFEIIDMVDRYKREFVVDEDTIPVELVDDVGHGGQYLMEDHTLEYCREEPFNPNISVRGPHNNPERLFYKNIDKRLENMLNSYVKPQVDQKVIKEMEIVLKEFGVDQKYLDLVVHS